MVILGIFLREYSTNMVQCLSLCCCHTRLLFLTFFTKHMLSVLKKAVKQGNEKQFRNHSCARYPTDVYFLYSFRLSATMIRANLWFSGKPKPHRYKFEASVPPIGLFVGGSLHYHSCTSEIEVF